MLTDATTSKFRRNHKTDTAQVFVNAIMFTDVKIPAYQMQNIKLSNVFITFKLRIEARDYYSLRSSKSLYDFTFSLISS